MGKPRYDTADKRWMGIGPYYAMFPSWFADDVIKRYTEAGDMVLDPFAGRATSIYSAAIQGRKGIGVELNPVGWVYGKTKLCTARQDEVEKRLGEIADKANNYRIIADNVSEFFRLCFSTSVRRFLLAARDQLNWRHSSSDWTLMGLLLVYLHGKRNDSLSNQMRQTKSMSPNYAVRWWKEHKLEPPDLDPKEFMLKRIRWRYSKGLPNTNGSQVYLGDCNVILTRLHRVLMKSGKSPIRLLFTSPPYFGVTNYHYDQWIRLWLLGYPSMPSSRLGKYRERFQQADEYAQLLETVFSKAAHLVAKGGIIYVRTDARDFTFNTTLNALRRVFPGSRPRIIKSPFNGATQTHLFGDRTSKKGEIDILLEK